MAKKEGNNLIGISRDQKGRKNTCVQSNDQNEEEYKLKSPFNLVLTETNKIRTIR